MVNNIELRYIIKKNLKDSHSFHHIIIIITLGSIGYIQVIFDM